MLGVLPGTYKYFVHDYSNRGNADNGVLARSGAEVKVYQGGQTYRFRADGESTGTIWNVCEVDVTENGAAVRRLDTYEYKQMKGSGGTGTVVLLIDTSSSMSNLIGQAKQAATEFLAAVPLDAGGRAGLVRFGSRAVQLHAISTNRDTLNRAVAGLGTNGSTPMSNALAVAQQMLRDVEGTRSIVVFTDGVPDDVGRTLREGAKAKEAGITVWAIGTAGANMRFLRQLTSTPDKAFFASPEKSTESVRRDSRKDLRPRRRVRARSLRSNRHEKSLEGVRGDLSSERFPRRTRRRNASPHSENPFVKGFSEPFLKPLVRSLRDLSPVKSLGCPLVLKSCHYCVNRQVMLTSALSVNRDLRRYERGWTQDGV